MRRVLGLLFAMALFMGGAAGCGSDDDNGGGTDDAPATPTNDDDGGAPDLSEGSIEDAIEAYCEATEEYVELVNASLDDMTNMALIEEMGDRGLELADMAQDLAARSEEFTTEDTQRFSECQAEATASL